MTLSSPVLPGVLPSRKLLELQALRALKNCSALIVLGKDGSGRTAFASRVLDSRTRLGAMACRLTGTPALREVAFATLAAVVSQLTGKPLRTDSPAHLIAALAHCSTKHAPIVFLDQSEDIDTQSTAALAQLATAGSLTLICVGRSVAELPAALRRLAVSDAAHRVNLTAIDSLDIGP